VTRYEKVLRRVLSGSSDASIGFEELCSLLRRLGFSERQRGTRHRIFFREGGAEILNLQPKGSHAKPYQVRQVRDVIVKYGLAGRAGDEEGEPDEA
jgi:hypothetical protein